MSSDVCIIISCLLFTGNMWYNAPMSSKELTNDQARGVRVSVVNLVVNIIVFIGKLFAGIASHSTALISDAIHSASDVLDTIIVMAGVKLSAKKPDKTHHFGYERMEAVAALILAVILFITGATIGIEAGESIISGEYRTKASPGLLALIVAIACIIIKEIMYWYTRSAGKALSSGALMATAWHSRADALSSLGALAGILGARMGLAILDPLAGICICLFVLKVAWSIFRNAAGKLTDRSAGEDLEESVRLAAEKIPQIKEVRAVRSRLFGNRVFIEADVTADSGLSVSECADIRAALKKDVTEKLPQVKDCLIQIFPADR